MPAIARVGDPIGCGDHIAKGSADVFVNNLPIARLEDKTTGHGPFPSTVLISGLSETVFANNKKIAMVEKTRIQRHCVGPSCHDAPVSVGSPDVFCEK